MRMYLRRRGCCSHECSRVSVRFTIFQRMREKHRFCPASGFDARPTPSASTESRPSFLGAIFREAASTTSFPSDLDLTIRTRALNRLFDTRAPTLPSRSSLRVHLLEDREDHVEFWPLRRILVHANSNQFCHVRRQAGRDGKP